LDLTDRLRDMVTWKTTQPVPLDVVPEPMSFSVNVIAPLPGDAPHWAIHNPDIRSPGSGPQIR
jgi:hypothetical protein